MMNFFNNILPRDVPTIGPDAGNYQETTFIFNWAHIDYKVRQLCFQSAKQQAGTIFSSAIIIGGNRMPQSYSGYVALAHGLRDKVNKVTILGIPDNDGSGIVDGKNDWGLHEQGAALAAQLIAEIDYLATISPEINLNIMLESAGNSALNQAMPDFLTRIKQLRHENSQLRINIRIVADSPVLDLMQVLTDAAGRFSNGFSIIAKPLAWLALQLSPKGYRRIKPVTIAQELNALSEVVELEFLLITAQNDIATRPENAAKLTPLLHPRIKLRVMNLPSSTIAGNWHVPGVLHFNETVTSLPTGTSISREQYVDFVSDPAAVKSYLDFVFSTSPGLRSS